MIIIRTFGDILRLEFHFIDITIYISTYWKQNDFIFYKEDKTFKLRIEGEYI